VYWLYIFTMCFLYNKSINDIALGPSNVKIVQSLCGGVTRKKKYDLQHFTVK